MSGFRADVDAMRAAGSVLRETADTVSAALGGLDAGVCADLGPGRLGSAVARLTEDARRDLDLVLGTVVEDAGLVDAAAQGYVAHDRAAAEELTRRAGGPS